MNTKTFFSSMLSKISVSLLAVGFAAISLSAEVFLKSNLVELGIHDAFSFGTASTQPVGFHGNVGGRLGFVADYDRNGWGVGSPPYAGDFFLPGSPEEGWGIEWTDASGIEHSFNNFGRNNVFNIPMTSLTNTSTGGTQQAVWIGTASSGSDKVKLVQTVTFNPGELFFTINVVMTNIGTTILNSLEYMRNVDPDQEAPWSGGYSTTNGVVYQPPRPANGSRSALAARPAGNTNKALTIAKGFRYGLTLGLGTIDPRAVVAASHGFANRDTDSILNIPNQPISSYADSAIVLAYDFGTLVPGQSISFDYAYILSADDLENALGALAAVSILQPTGTVSGSSVIYQATTDDIDNTSKLSFYIDGTLVGEDTSVDAGGVFESTFNSLDFTNGTHTLKVVAHFSDGKTVEKTGSITVDNSGPAMAFNTPLPGDRFSGGSIPVIIGGINPDQPPVRVSFFRESSSSGSVFLGESVTEPFSTAFGVTDLPDGETVVIKAVGTDAHDRTTTITVSGSVVSNQAPVAVCQDVSVEANAMCSAIVSIDNGSYDPDGDAITLAQDYSSFGLGTFNVVLTVSDSSLSKSCSAVVEVSDTTAPTIVTPADKIVEATAVASVIDIGTATSEDYCSIPVVSNDAPETFNLGTTIVTWSTTDATGNTVTKEQNITVVDTMAPVLTLPSNITIEATSTLTTIDIGSATATDIFPVTISNNAPASYPVGVTTVIWTAVDVNGNSVSGKQTITVTDTTPPVVNDVAVVPQLVKVSEPYLLTAVVDDSPVSNIKNAEYSINGGPWSQMLVGGISFDALLEPALVESVEKDLVASSEAGVYEICVRGSDVHANTSENVCTYLVTYDPNGGFVTGGGWIDSPEGAYMADVTLSGKASFGFVSKYKKGATVPTGNTEFQFKTANFNFKSSSYEWLVVTGSNYAKFKGVGSINGEGEYKFMIWAGDNESDTFRIKIWSENASGNEEIVYDNGFDQVIGGGSIVIHTGKK